MKKTPQKLEEKVIELLEKTTDSHSEIGRKVRLSNGTVWCIQNRAIKKGLLNEKYRRLHSGTIQYKQDETIKLIKKTTFSLIQIGKEIHLSDVTIKKIQDDTIKEYEKLKKHGISEEELEKRNNVLNPKYRRLSGGIVKYQRDKVVEMLKKTNYNLKDISKEVDLSDTPIKNIQNRMIKERILEEKYRRLHGGIVKYQQDETIELLKKTNYNLKDISKEVKIGRTAVKNIEDRAIMKYEKLKKHGISEEELEKRNNVLNPKYRRLSGGIVKYQRDKVVEMLKKTNYNLSIISKELGLDNERVRIIQNKAIKEDLLDEKYRRLHGGIVKYQKYDALELLRTTDYNLGEIGEKVALKGEGSTIWHIQNDAIEEGILDESRRRPFYKNNNNLEAVLRDYRSEIASNLNQMVMA